MRKTIMAMAIAAVATSACNMSDATSGVKSAGSTVARGATGVAASLVNVNLSNVLNNLALDLKVDKANIPINAQIPINVAANVCGVSINILSFGGKGGSSQGCNANSVSPELVQAVQQQLAANGSVGGGAQTNGGSTGTNTSTTGTASVPTGTAPPSASGSTSTSTSTGTTQSATTPSTASPK